MKITVRNEMNEYKIEKITDFLEVPEDRLDDCLVDFKSFLEHTKPLLALAKTGAELLGQDPEEAIKLMGFTWVDDGKTDGELNLEVKG